VAPAPLGVTPAGDGHRVACIHDGVAVESLGSIGMTFGAVDIGLDAEATLPTYAVAHALARAAMTWALTLTTLAYRATVWMPETMSVSSFMICSALLFGGSDSSNSTNQRLFDAQNSCHTRHQAVEFSIRRCPLVEPGFGQGLTIALQEHADVDLFGGVIRWHQIEHGPIAADRVQRPSGGDLDATAGDLDHRFHLGAPANQREVAASEIHSEAPREIMPLLPHHAAEPGACGNTVRQR